MMKPILFFLSGLLMLATTGCMKETSQEGETNEIYFVRFLLDGQRKEYLQNVSAVRSADNGFETVSIKGLQDLTANASGVILLVAEAGQIVAQPYPEVPGSDSPAIFYRDLDGAEFTSLFMTTLSGLEIAISQIDSATVRGTFKGNISDINGNIREVSDGSFYVKFQ